MAFSGLKPPELSPLDQFTALQSNLPVFVNLATCVLTNLKAMFDYWVSEEFHKPFPPDAWSSNLPEEQPLNRYRRPDIL